MRKSLYTSLIFIFVVFGVQAQLTQLVYLKTFPSTGVLQYHPNDSIYILPLNIFDSNVDASIFPNDTPYELSSEFSQASVIYDAHLKPIHSIQIGPSDMVYEFVKKMDNHFIFSSNSAVPFGSGTQNFQSNPPLTLSNSPDIITTTNMLRLTTDGNPTLHIPFHCDWYYWEYMLAHPHPIPNFTTAAQAEGRAYKNRAAYVNSGHIITTLTMFDDVVINWQDTYAYPEGAMWGTLWIKTNPINGITTVSPLMSETGSMISHNVFPAADNEFIYRTAVVRGHNVQISPDGSIWENSEDDSLYHAFVVKENTFGEQEWATQLYAYTKTADDYNAVNGNFTMTTHTESLIELNGNVYVGTSMEILYASLTDSIYFIDFDGTEKYFPPPEEWDSDGPYIAHAERTIYQLDDLGQPARSITQKLPFYEYTKKEYFITKSKPNLFEINGVLGFTNTYLSNSDTTIFLYRNDMNSIDSMAIDLPAGKGEYIVWLDQELTILDVTNFPFTTSNDYISGLKIVEATLFNADTLLVTGILRNDITTHLDPEGQAEEIAYSGFNSFAGFYTVPTFLTSYKSIQNKDKNRGLEIYPNPGKDRVTIQNRIAPNSRYEMYDLTGKKVRTGRILNHTTLSVEALAPGMYLLKITEPNGNALSGKFMRQ